MKKKIVCRSNTYRLNPSDETQEDICVNYRKYVNELNKVSKRNFDQKKSKQTNKNICGTNLIIKGEKSNEKQIWVSRRTINQWCY